MNREKIYKALFKKLKGCYSWVTTDRVLKHWADVPSDQQPALFMTQVNEDPQTITRQPTKWSLKVKIYVYTYTSDGGDEDGERALQINEALDAITEAMKPDNAVVEVQNLGGLVEWVKIDGTIETDEGFLGQQSVAIIPITIYLGD